jgi:hypothetical protein
LVFILQKTIIFWPFVTMNCIFTNDIIILLIHREISISICILVIYHGIITELYTFCSFTLVLSGSHKKKRKWFLLFFLHCHYTLTLIFKSYSLQLLLAVFFSYLQISSSCSSIKWRYRWIRIVNRTNRQLVYCCVWDGKNLWARE